MDDFYKSLPKIELHAHLNGSLSHSTMLELKRLHADSGIKDNTNAFFDEFRIGAGDSVELSECFQVFSIAQSLTSTTEALKLATTLTLKEFQDDGCIYIELRSTPRSNEYMTKEQYIDAIIAAIKTSQTELSIIARYIISVDRRHPVDQIDETVNLAIEYYKKYPSIICGLELSGDPTKGSFESIYTIFVKARDAGLKISLHCGEISNPVEIGEMLIFKPERIGHGTCIHPRLGGTEKIWSQLCHLKIPVELCLTSNVKCKAAPSYEDHHFKELYQCDHPLIICTDDKGVFGTSLSLEYRLCAETFGLEKMQVAALSLKACQYIFAEELKPLLEEKVRNFMQTIL